MSLNSLQEYQALYNSTREPQQDSPACRAFPGLIHQAGLLRNQLVNRFSTFNPYQPLVETIVEEAQLVRIEPHLGQHRGMEVLDV